MTNMESTMPTLADYQKHASLYGLTVPPGYRCLYGPPRRRCRPCSLAARLQPRDDPFKAFDLLLENVGERAETPYSRPRTLRDGGRLITPALRLLALAVRD